MEKSYLTKRLIRIAELDPEIEGANSAMQQLKRTVNKTYHWCHDWDDMVICDTDPEFEACTCKLDNL